MSFYIENVGAWFAKPAATGVTGWVNFPYGFKPKEIRSLNKQNQDVGLSDVYEDKGMTYLKFPLTRALFYKEKWFFEIDVEIPQERKNYALFIPVQHERGNCGTKVLKVKVV